MDNIVKVQRCLPELHASCGEHHGALEGLIARAEFEIDQYDLEMDVIDFLEGVTVYVDDKGVLHSEDENGEYVFSKTESKWVDDEEADEDE